MRGIILAGGTGSRLWPITRVGSKQLIPVFDKPMIYYPLSTLILAGVREIMIITSPQDSDRFYELLGDGQHLGVQLEYMVQREPKGIAHAFIIAEEFIGSDPVCLVLGDNIFFGSGLGQQLQKCHTDKGAHIFGYPVADPSQYGVIEFDEDECVVSLEEKPRTPRSRYVVPGLYFYDSDVVDIAHGLGPSARGELEITDINSLYLREGRLTATLLERGSMWLDTGTFASLAQASEFVRVVEERQGMKIGCVEEVAWRQGLITDSRLRDLAEPLLKSGYGSYLLRLLDE